MIVSITGGTGFVGKKLAAKHICNGDSVRILTRRPNRLSEIHKEVEIHTGDLLGVPNIIKNFVNNSDILYHCAAELNKTELMEKTHIQGTSQLLKAASGRIGRWIQLSSVGVYGPQTDGIVNEKTSINPLGVYEITKAKSDEIIIDAGAKDIIEYTILRPSIIFGPSMRNQSLFQLIKAIDKRLFFFIGRKGAYANYIHVDNIIHALLGCGKSEAAHNQVFNLSEHMLIDDFIGAIAKKLEKKAPKFRLPENIVRFSAGVSQIIDGFPLTPSRVDALTSRVSYSTKKIEHKMGYQPIKTIEQGLSEMVAAYKNIYGKKKNTSNHKI